MYFGKRLWMMIWNQFMIIILGPPNAKIVGTKWVKIQTDGSVDKYGNDFLTRNFMESCPTN